MTEFSSWAARYRTLFEASVKRYRPGIPPEDLVSDDDLAFLKSLGGTAREFFDLVEDRARGGGWDAETSLLLTAARRDYFLRRDRGKQRKQKPSRSLPPKSAALDGVKWLPRIMEKARRKLQGTLDDDLMFGCGGDAAFCRRHGVELVDFLHVVRDNWEDENAILAWVREQEK